MLKIAYTWGTMHHRVDSYSKQELINDVMTSLGLSFGKQHLPNSFRRTEGLFVFPGISVRCTWTLMRAMHSWLIVVGVHGPTIKVHHCSGNLCRGKLHACTCTVHARVYAIICWWVVFVLICCCLCLFFHAEEKAIVKITNYIIMAWFDNSLLRASLLLELFENKIKFNNFLQNKYDFHHGDLCHNCLLLCNYMYASE